MSNNPYAITQVDISEWTIVGYMYIGDSNVMAATYSWDHAALTKALQDRGLSDDPDDIIYHANGGCAACGTHFAHGAVVVNTRTDDIIGIGGICAGTWGAAEEIGVRKARASRAAQLAKVRDEKAAAAADYLIENADIAEILATLDHDIIKDIAEKLPRYGSLTSRQEDLVRKLAADEPERLIRKAAAIKREEALAAAPKLIEGRYEITGTVISVKIREGYMGEAVLKMLVELDDLNRVWGTVPRSILPGMGTGINKDEDLLSRTVNFTAAVERSQDDVHFGFYKRPTKATVSEPVRSNA